MKDFHEFAQYKDEKVPQDISEHIKNYVQKELNPSHQQVFIKLISIQAFIGFLTLIFCPQFQISLTNNFDFFHFFHHNFGESICMMICGSIFTGSGALFAAYILQAQEIKKIKESRLLYHISISIIALSTFLVLGSVIYLVLSLYWFIGSVISAMLLFEVNTILRKGLFNT